MATSPTSGPGGSVSGPSAVQASITKTLNNAQVRSLPSTDLELIAAPGPGKMIVPLVAYLIPDFAVAYSGIDADTDYPALWVAHKSSPIYLNEFIDNPDTPGVEVGQASLTDFLTQVNTFGPGFWSLLPIRQSLVPVGTPAAVTDASAGGGTPGDFENVSVKLGADNSIDFTGGDAANTLTVTVLYTVLDV